MYPPHTEFYIINTSLIVNKCFLGKQTCRLAETYISHSEIYLHSAASGPKKLQACYHSGIRGKKHMACLYFFKPNILVLGGTKPQCTSHLAQPNYRSLCQTWPPLWELMLSWKSGCHERHNNAKTDKLDLYTKRLWLYRREAVRSLGADKIEVDAVTQLIRANSYWK